MTTEQISQCEADGLREYTVRVLEDCDGFTKPEDMESIIFECWAENEEHATEQAMDAYPNCSIIYVTERMESKC